MSGSALLNTSTWKAVLKTPGAASSAALAILEQVDDAVAGDSKVGWGADTDDERAHRAQGRAVRFAEIAAPPMNPPGPNWSAIWSPSFSEGQPARSSASARTYLTAVERSERNIDWCNRTWANGTHPVAVSVPTSFSSAPLIDGVWWTAQAVYETADSSPARLPRCR